MSYRVVEAQSTPNPNAMKFILDRVLSEQTISFRDEQQAKDHPLAKRLFGIKGVSGLMFLGDFITVTKTPDVDWKTLSASVKKILASV